MASVALTEGMLTIVFGMAMGLSLATTAMVARRTGEKDTRGAAVATVHAIGFGIAVSLALVLFGGFTAPRLLKLMGASAGIVGAGSTYTTLWTLFSGRGRIAVRRSDLKLNLDALVRLIRVSASGMVQFLVSNVSWLGLVRIISKRGAADDRWLGGEGVCRIHGLY